MQLMNTSFYWVSILSALLLMSGCKSALAQKSSQSSRQANSQQTPTPASSVTFVPTDSLAPIETRVFTPVALRGYGTVSGTLSRFSSRDQKISSLQIACASPDKAKILHAKFISDLGVLPGVNHVKLATAAGQVSAWVVEHEGCICALCSGTDVLILSAPNPGWIETLYSTCVKGDRSGFFFEPQVQVPMYLDRWDRFGFRCYESAYETPPGQTEQTYDYTSQFDFMKRNGRTGPVIVTAVSAMDGAEGLMREPSWDWLALAARQYMLPLGLNLNFGPQTWLANRYRDQMAQKMPQYSGGFYRVASTGYPGGLGGEGWLSWSATTSQDEALADVQQVVRRYSDFPNLTTWLEPHGELRHGEHDIFLEYGLVADATFRSFLKEKYHTLEAVIARWGNDQKIKSWDDVKVPEVASFLGWGPQAMDLTGDWRVLSQDAPAQPDTGSKAAPYPPFDPGWFAPKFDDSSAATITAPGNDQAMFLPHRPAVYRRHFNVDPAWRQKNHHVWLYVWDLNGHLYGSLNDKTDVLVCLNGKELPPSPIVDRAPHFLGVDISSDLLAGGNDLAIGVPQGYLAYRIYLSPDAPAMYPNLGEEKNARWADFSDWQAYTRLNSFRRGAEMIRQVDPDRQIIFMSPFPYFSAIKSICEDFGGEFHDTGGMAGSWNDADPMISSGSGLPSSAEPGSPAQNVKEYRLFMARWLTEGIQGIDYFICVGNLMWMPDVRKEFESTQNMVHLVGKFHIPKAETGILLSDRAQYLTMYPWGGEPNMHLSDSTRLEGYDRWSAGAYLLPLFPRDGLSDGDFHRGNAAKYRVILDSNTAIIDDGMLKDIESYVRDGGVFVTFVQTGRSTSTEFDSWPISKLTGYKVTHIDPHDADGRVTAWRPLGLAPGQNIFSEDYWKSGPMANGLSLKKVADDCRDLMRWKDGSVAVGMRPLGKGYIIQVGAKFCNDRLGDGAEQTTRMFSDILDHFKIARVPATAKGVTLRHFLTNNGLYDLWMAANMSDRRVITDLVWQPGFNPRSCIEVQTGEPFPVDHDGSGSLLKNLRVEPGEVRVFLSPRDPFDVSASDWFTLQRNWWRGTVKPSDPPLAPPQMKLARDITQDWLFQPIVDEKTDVLAMVAPDYDDSRWQPMRVGVWNFPNYPKVRHAVFRRRFTVPTEWTSGRVALWYQAWVGTTFLDRGRVFLDGQMIRDFSAIGIMDEDLGGRLKPGSAHTLAAEIVGEGVLDGSRGDCWLAYCPSPQATTDLAGPWIASQDVLHFDTKLTLPGQWDGSIARRHILIDPTLAANRNVILHIETDAPIVGVITNGHFVRRHHHMIGTRFDLNITPWIHIGQDNQLELVTWERPGKGSVQDVSLHFYDPAIYP